MKEMDPLSHLKDVHAPDAIGWWPPAPGWWILAIVVTAVAIVLFHVLRKRHRNLAYKREAQQELDRIRSHFQQQSNPHDLLRELSELLKRTSITRYGRETVAGLSGDQWLQFLDQSGSTQQFSRGPGRALIHDKYRPHPEIDSDELIQLCERWLRQQA